MPFEMTSALFIADPEKYAAYRVEIAPLLEVSGAEFRYDFTVAKTLKSATGHDINRVFVLRFPDRDAKERFFTDPRYQEIRARLFAPAVPWITTIAEHGVC